MRRQFFPRGFKRITFEQNGNLNFRVMLKILVFSQKLLQKQNVRIFVSYVLFCDHKPNFSSQLHSPKPLGYSNPLAYPPADPKRNRLIRRLVLQGKVPSLAYTCTANSNQARGYFFMRANHVHNRRFRGGFRAGEDFLDPPNCPDHIRNNNCLGSSLV